MIKYLARSWVDIAKNAIVPVEIASETSQSVVDASGRRHSKVIGDQVYADSFAEAKEWLVDRARRQLEIAEKAVDTRRKRLDELEQLEESRLKNTEEACHSTT